MEKVIPEWVMPECKKRGKKKDYSEDYRAEVRENQVAALQAPVIPILITSQCVERQLFFDPFVMISIQPVRTVPIQNGFCRISRYCVTACLTKHSPESCISNSLPHLCMCAIWSTWAAHCFCKVPPFVCVTLVRVCVTGEGGVLRQSIPYSWAAAGRLLSARFSSVAPCCHHNTTAVWPAALSQSAFNTTRPMTVRRWAEHRDGGWERRKIRGEKSAGKGMKGGGGVRREEEEKGLKRGRDQRGVEVKEAMEPWRQ